MQKHITADNTHNACNRSDRTHVRVVIVTLDNHLASTISRVNKQLAADNSGITVSMHAAGEWGRDEQRLKQCHEDIAVADIVIVTMLFMEDHINAVLEPLKQRRDHCDAMICCMCSGNIVKLTRMGRFAMNGTDGRASAFFKRLRQSRSKKKSATSGKLQMAMLRRIPRILRFIPGTAQDIRHYFLVLQYWLAGSDINALNMIRMVVNEYADGDRLPVRGSFAVELPRHYLDVGLYHPALAERMSDRLADLPYKRHASKGRVGLLLMRSYVLAGNTAHYDAVISTLEANGYAVVPAFASGLDARPAIDQYFMSDGKPQIDALLSLTGFSLVGGPAYNDAAAAQACLSKLNVPYLSAMGLEFQTMEQWERSEQGLLPVESAMMVAIPELDGAIHPTVFGGRNVSTATEPGNDMLPHPERVARLCERIGKLISLRKTLRSERRIAIVIFNFPPNAGAVGSAAHLSVFESVYNTLHAMAQQGYTVDLPESVDALRESVLHGNAAQYGTDANVLHAIPVDEHIKRETHLDEIEQTWGSAPGKQLSNGREIFILGKRFGNVDVCVQPGFGYEGDPMRLLFERGFAPTHAFSAFYRYLREDINADAVLHFGTHGALEFMPGKQTGMSAACWPERLIGALPNYYLYAANNASEGSIAKRRAGATLISYLTPPVTHAGLYKGLLDLQSSIDRWRAIAPSERDNHAELIDLIKTQTDAIDLDVDVSTVSIDVDHDVDSYVDACRAALSELENTLIPHGLHVVGQTTKREQRKELLSAIASAETSMQSGSDGDSAISDADVEVMIDNIIKLAPGEQLNGEQLASEHRRDESENEKRENVLHALQTTLTHINSELQQDAELPAIINALDGHYTEPVVGGDLLRTPEILPTGRNLHGFDPFRMPSASAIHSGDLAATSLIERHMQDGNRFPETVAIVLWGTDNLKTEGAPIAQAMSLMGAAPRFDNYGRLCGASLIPLETLGRPRIDVVMTLSGIFRDLLPQQTRLLAEAAWLAASAENESVELNFVRKNALAYQQENQCDLETAALRVFSNADGAYGSNLNHLIDDGSWSDSDELADVFAKRKSFAYSRHGNNHQDAHLFEAVLSRVELATQNLDSVEIGVTSIDHYYDTLGGISRCAQRANPAKQAPKLYISDDTRGEARVRTLSEQVELETRTRALNPKWYEQMLEHGYEGVKHIEMHVTNTVGWSATTEQVKPWVYQQLTDTFLLDEKMRNRLADLNPDASLRVVNRLHEAHERNYWQPDEETLAALHAAGEDLEDRLEGIMEGVRA